VRMEPTPTCMRWVVYDHAVDHPELSLTSGASIEEENGRGLRLLDACSQQMRTELAGEECRCT
jgi:hypothetical protein